MKKMFISVIVLAMSMMTMATETAYVQIRLTGITGGVSNSVYLTEDDAYTNAYESGADAEKIMDLANSNSVLMYGFVGALKCGDVVALNLDGFALGFTTNMVDTDYKLTFKNVSGRELTLYDRVTKTQTVITNNGTYNFSVETSQVGQVQINDRFVINYVAPATGYTVTPNAAGYATFSAAEATVIPTGATAYTGTISGEELVLNQIMGGYVPANTGVIVAGVAGTPYNFAIYDGSVDAIAGNALKATATYNTSMENVFVLKGDAFLEYVGTNALAPNKAYIQLPAAGPNNAPKRIRMVINGATDVENVQGDNVQCTKIIENGQIYILHNGAKYNVQGQIVQ